MTSSYINPNVYVDSIDTITFVEVLQNDATLGPIVFDVLSFGPPGPAGSKWLTGTGVPINEIGVIGDFYLRSNGDVYGPKALSGWGSVQVTLQLALSAVPAQPLAATATAGSSGLAADAGHRHPFPTASQVGADATGTAAAAVAAHVAAADPHPVYTTAAEAAAAAPVQSVAGRTGAVTIGAADVSGLGTAATTNATAYATAVQGTDQRTPTDGSVTDAKVASAGLSASSINWVAIADWQANTAYAKGALVSYLGVAYRRSVAGTSGATFVGTNWQQITPSTGTTSGTLAAGDDARITGALSAATAATIYQPLDSDLTAIAALSTTTYGRSLLTQEGAAQVFANILFSNAGSPVIYSAASILTNGGAGISTDLTAVSSSGTTPNHGAAPNTGTTSTGACGLYLNPGMTSWGGSRGRQTIQSYRYLSLSALIRIPTLSDATDTFTVFVGGYFDAAGYSLRDFCGAHIVGSTITATNITSGTVTSSSSTATITANTWAKMQVVYDGSVLSVIVNNGTPITVASGFPGNSLGWGVTIAKTAGTNNRNVNVANTPSFAGWTALP